MTIMFTYTVGLVLLSTIQAITAQTSCTEDDIRLEQTPITLTASNAGRLEICRNGVWGSIQASSSTSFWSEKNILVACRQLGFNGGLNSVPANQVLLSDRMGASSPVHYSNVNCDGTEPGLADCERALESPSMTHNSDVYIVCLPGFFRYTDLHTVANSVGDVRLVGSTVNGEGAVEILTGLGWSTICPDSSWSQSDAMAICQNLGYESGQVENYMLDTSKVEPRNLYDAVCASASRSIESSFTRILAEHCTFLEVGSSNECQFEDNMFAGVICSSSRREDGSSRLVVNRELSTTRFQGVVEILYDGRWGVLCRSTTDVDSLCRGFGYNRDDSSTVSVIPSRLQSVESRLKPLWIPDLRCPSSSTGLSTCILEFPLGYGTCGSGDILVLDCGSSLKQGLFSYEIACIVIGVLIGLSGIAFFIYAIDKNRYKTWQQKKWYKILCNPRRWCDPCKGCCKNPFKGCCTNPSRNQVTITSSSRSRGGQQHNPPPSANPVLREVVNSEPEPVPEEVLNNSELTKVPPPAYVEAVNYSNTDAAVPCAPPPAYSVGPAYPVGGGNPAYPPVGGGNPAYPPVGSGDPAYPPVGSGDPVYPPVGGQYPPYPTEDQVYPPPTEIGLPYPT